jgi:hypothetical protein
MKLVLLLVFQTKHFFGVFFQHINELLNNNFIRKNKLIAKLSNCISSI